MSWARLDDNADEELAFLSAGAYRLYVATVTYSRRNHRGGRLHIARDLVPLAAKHRIRNLAGVIEELVTDVEDDEPLWLRDGDYYVIRSYEKFNPLTGAERVRRLRHSREVRGVTDAALAVLRQQAFERDGFICRYCGEKPEVRWLVLDHVDPLPDGCSELENLVTACRSCNKRKGGRDPKAAGMQLQPVTPVTVPRAGASAPGTPIPVPGESPRETHSSWRARPNSRWLGRGEEPVEVYAARCEQLGLGKPQDDELGLISRKARAAIGRGEQLPDVLEGCRMAAVKNQAGLLDRLIGDAKRARLGIVQTDRAAREGSPAPRPPRVEPPAPTPMSDEEIAAGLALVRERMPDILKRIPAALGEEVA